MHETIKKMADPEYTFLKSALRDALIFRFKHSVDIFLKFLKEYLAVNHSKTVPPSPMQIVKAAQETGLITQDEHTLLHTMIDDRNRTPYAYEEAIAQEITEKIPTYHKTMSEILQRLAEDI